MEKCVAGCMAFTGGELRHHKDCPFYPESFSKMYDDLKKELERKTEKRIEDYNIITPDNKIWNYHKWMLCPDMVNDVSDNPYPVMYVDGNAIYEGDKLLFTNDDGIKQIRTLKWQHRLIIKNNKDWIDSWSFNILEDKKNLSTFAFKISNHIIEIEADSEKNAMSILIEKYWNQVSKTEKVELFGQVLTKSK